MTPLSPKANKALIGWAHRALRDGRPDAAASVAQAAGAAAQGDMVAQWMSIHVLLEAKRFEDARAIAETATRSPVTGQQRFYLIYAQARIALAEGRMEAAICLLERYLAANPMRREMHYTLASLLPHLGRYQDANRLAERGTLVACGDLQPTSTRAIRFPDPSDAVIVTDPFGRQVTFQPTGALSDITAIYFVGCDSRYFQMFGTALAHSLTRRAKAAVALHFHLINPDPAADALLLAMRRAVALPIICSRETADLTNLSVRQRRTYLACARYLVLPDLLARYGKPMIIADADQLVVGDLGPLLEDLGRHDIGVMRDDTHIANIFGLISASVLGVNSTAGGARFACTLRDTVLGRLADPAAVGWHLDQAALAVAHLWHRELKTLLLPTWIMDSVIDPLAAADELAPDALFWSITMAHGHTSRKLATTLFQQFFESETTPRTNRQVFDCCVFDGDNDRLAARCAALDHVVDRFVVVEGLPQRDGTPPAIKFAPCHPGLTPFLAKLRHVIVADTPDVGTRAREAWVWNAVLRGAPDATPNDLLLLSDPWVIPAASAVVEMRLDHRSDVFEYQPVMPGAAAHDLALPATIAATRARLYTMTPGELREAQRAGRLAALIHPDIVRGIAVTTDRAAPRHAGAAIPAAPAVPSPPVVICPYLHELEAGEIMAKFGSITAQGRRIEFHLWQDQERIGPEFAFEHCWNQVPGRDVVIIHSDMAPMPDQPPGHWYDELCRYRDELPNAGMIACNLYYPAGAADGPAGVQCAGGTFSDRQVGHLHGPVIDHADGTQGVPKDLLSAVRPVDWVTFGGVLIRREVIRAVGGFDRRYKWAYVMDVDYSFEARLRGFRLFQVPVSLLHEESRSTRHVWDEKPELKEHLSRNFASFYAKWSPFYAALPNEADICSSAADVATG